MVGKKQSKSQGARRSQPSEKSRLIKCKNCGKPVKEYASKPRVYCSGTCYRAWLARMRWVDRTCRHCGKTFRARRCYIERSAKEGRVGAQFCSRKCWKLARGRGVPESQLIRTCETCGQTFRFSPGEFLSGKARRHCSMKCRERRKIMICETCGKEFERQQNENRRYCSRACYHRSRLASQPEMLVEWILKEHGIEYETEWPIGIFHVDFLLPKLRIALEVDGGYWHDEKERPVSRAKKERLIRERGLTLVRIPEVHLKKNAEREVLRPIMRAVQAGMRSLASSESS